MVESLRVTDANNLVINQSSMLLIIFAGIVAGITRVFFRPDRLVPIITFASIINSVSMRFAGTVKFCCEFVFACIAISVVAGVVWLLRFGF